MRLEQWLRTGEEARLGALSTLLTPFSPGLTEDPGIWNLPVGNHPFWILTSLLSCECDQWLALLLSVPHSQTVTILQNPFLPS